MSGDTTKDIQDLIARLKAGDDSARWELLERAYGRLRGLASKILGDYARVRDDGLWKTTEVASEAQLRLAKALQEVALADEQHFFRLAAQKIRFLLIDFVKRLPRSERDDEKDRASRRPAWLSHDYQDVLARLLEELQGLPEEQYEILDLEFCFGFNGREIADALNVDEKTVRHRRRRAYEAIATKLRTTFPGLDDGLAPGQD